MEVIFDIIFSFLGEILIQIFYQILLELGITSISKVKAPAKSPILAGIGYLLLGIIAGGISLLFFRNQFITSPELQILNLVFTPIFAGLVMMEIGKSKAKYGKVTTRMDSFTYGAIFAFGMAGIRYLCKI